ncbi:histidinol-phosphate transaminase [Peribacillus cavernae]|uniref:Histidinol-phosphate aminotransferase n=1 Tax=Peribacillus cavernae TaxID=1674310 RepID=A0A3S0TWL3_9BACI|nr:histidinol-phosphate transaminase [Peribacillus cavernae]MDQ0218983.1 histidinol-phosphate aminotransferase [Peribacillus cavernae]RUQ29311.1 histidinol-phosphate transaminase [Peribacillus cavernae]
MKWKDAVLSLKPYQPGKSIQEVQKQYGLESITKLASNENPSGCSETVKEVISSFNESYAIYPDGYATMLRQAVSSYLGVKETELIFGNGTDEIIQVISRSLLTSNWNTVMATPSFSQYRHNAVIEGAEIREVELVGGAHNLPRMLEEIDENTAVVWLCTPNNPTGVYITEAELISFLKEVPKDVLVVIDEAYFEYVDAADYPDSTKLIETYKNIIVLRTFSKIYGLASLRVGYGVANEEIIQKLEPARAPFNTNTLAQLAAMTAISDQEFIAECKLENRKGLQQYYRFCEEEGLSYYPSQGNFILIDFQADGDEVFQFLLERGFIVRSGQALGFPTSVRVTVGSAEQNKGIIEIMKEYLASKKS